MGNKKKTISLVITIAFSILLIGSIHLFLENTKKSATQYTYQYEYFSVIFHSDQAIPEDKLQEIINHDSVKRLIPIKRLHVPHKGIGITTMTHSYALSREDALYLIHLLNIDATVPELENQMILSKNIVKNNQYQEGQFIFEDEPIQYHSSFESDYLIGFVLSTIDAPNSYIIIPEENRLREVNQFLSTHHDNQYTVIHIDNMNQIIDDVLGDVDILTRIITIIIIISVGIGLGISTFVHYYQRRKEFAVLSSIGFSHKKILMKISSEIVFICFLGLVGGFLLLGIEIVLINRLILMNAGVHLYQLDGGLFGKMIIIPMFSFVFSLIPTSMLLKKIDTISIIEGEV